MSMNNSGMDNTHMEKARESQERVERIAKTTNKSSFMSLGDKNIKLISEELQNASSGNKKYQPILGDSSNIDDSYLNDDSIPAEIFSLI